MFKGSFVALITPFRNGKVDEAAFVKLVEWQIEQGTHGLVPVRNHGRGRRRFRMTSTSVLWNSASKPRGAAYL